MGENLNWDSALKYIQNKQDVSVEEQFLNIINKRDKDLLVNFITNNIDFIQEVFQNPEEIFTNEQKKTMFIEQMEQIFSNFDKEKNRLKAFVKYDGKISNLTQYIFDNVNRSYALFSFSLFLNNLGVEDNLIKEFIHKNKNKSSQYHQFVEKSLSGDNALMYFIEKIPEIFTDSDIRNHAISSMENYNNKGIDFINKIKKAKLLNKEDYLEFVNLAYVKLNINKKNFENLITDALTIYSEYSKDDLLPLFNKEILASKNLLDDGVVSQYNKLLILKVLSEDKFMKEKNILNLEASLYEKNFNLDSRITIERVKKSLVDVKVQILKNKANKDIDENDILKDSFLKELQALQEGGMSFNSGMSMIEIEVMAEEELILYGTLSKKTLLAMFEYSIQQEIDDFIYSTLNSKHLKLDQDEIDSLYAKNKKNLIKLVNSDIKNVDYYEKVYLLVEEYQNDFNNKKIIEKIEKKIGLLKSNLKKIEKEESLFEKHFEKEIIINIANAFLSSEKMLELIESTIKDYTREKKTQFIATVEERFSIKSMEPMIVRIIKETIENNESIAFSDDYLKSILKNSLQNIPVYQLSRHIKKMTREKQSTSESMFLINRDLDNGFFNVENVYMGSERDYQESSRIYQQINEKNIKRMKEHDKKNDDKLKELELATKNYKNDEEINFIFKLTESINDKVNLSDDEQESFVFISQKYFEHHKKIPSFSIIGVNNITDSSFVKFIAKYDEIDKVKEVVKFINETGSFTAIDDKTISSLSRKLKVKESQIVIELLNVFEADVFKRLDNKILGGIQWNNDDIWQNKEVALKIAGIFQHLSLGKKNMLLNIFPENIASIFRYFENSEIEDWRATLREAFMQQVLSTKSERVMTKKKI